MLLHNFVRSKNFVIKRGVSAPLFYSEIGMGNGTAIIVKLMLGNRVIRCNLSVSGKRRTTMKYYLLALLILLQPVSLAAQRKFIHPGITYTQADLDRMKAMIEARREPFYSTFVKFAASSFAQSTAGGHANVTQISEGQHNNTIGMDGRKAHDNALMWHLTGNKACADNAVKLLNGYLNLTNSSCRGTAPLDNGKIYMLIEAAELMRDYNGWAPADQKKFKDMLVHPGYSTKAPPSSHYSLTDSLNDVTFYWNIYNFDRGRFGNQGLFAARGLIAMGIYLDNDTIYDRVYRYLLGLSRRPDDLPYPPGPAVIKSKRSETEYMIDYDVNYTSEIADYGFDEQLRYYIYQNGQCQESCRDQAHALVGVGMYTCIAEIAWNQGDSLYKCLNNRILKGIEYSTRYNLTIDRSYQDQSNPWEPTGYSTSETDCTFENNLFFQTQSRSGRWFGKNINPDKRSSDFGTGGWREQALAHYKVRMGVNASAMKWLQRSHDRLIEDYGFENWGVSGHHYEWFGWGTLTKRRTVWMAGDGGTFVNNMRISELPRVPCTVKAVDYDFFTGDGEGRTYHNAGNVQSTLYRTDGTVEIINDGGEYVVTDIVAGEWMNYSLIFPPLNGDSAMGKSHRYNIYATCKTSGEGAALFAAVDSGAKTGVTLGKIPQWQEVYIGVVSAQCGANVLRLFIEGDSNLLQLKNIRVALNNGQTSISNTPETASPIVRSVINCSYMSGRHYIYLYSPEPSRITLINSLGKIVFSKDMAKTSGVIDIGGIPSGFYFVQVKTVHTFVAKRIVVP